jgi:TM2 domain-containing membrane protein YozV
LDLSRNSALVQSAIQLAAATGKHLMAQHPIPNRPKHLDWFAAFLSYLVPGLGQVYQGRFGKGVLFFIALYLLFFYGMWMGSWKNVYLPQTNTKNNMLFSAKPAGDIENRPHFAGQFWIGVAAWPASPYGDRPS